MDNFKCAFNGTMMAEQFACARAHRVTRRAGPDVACDSQAAHQRCAALFERLKSAALPAFGVEDDLLSMPHSVIVKIQFGGLAGLQCLQRPDAALETPVDDIDALVRRALEQFGSVDAVPCERFVEAMTSYPLRRRGR